MHIYLNGENRETKTEVTLSSLVDDLGLGGKRFAVEVNGELIPKSEHGGYRLQHGDKVEVVQAIGGG